MVNYQLNTLIFENVRNRAKSFLYSFLVIFIIFFIFFCYHFHFHLGLKIEQKLEDDLWESKTIIFIFIPSRELFHCQVESQKGNLAYI